MMKKCMFDGLNFFLFLFLCCSTLTIFNPLEGSLRKETSLQEMYEYQFNHPSDISEHIPVLRQLSSECSSVTEIGIKSLASTWGILQGLSESSYAQRQYMGIDIKNFSDLSYKLAKDLAEENGVKTTFWSINEMQIEIEPTDMLFIDSLHTYCHLTYELETFSPKVQKYICMHFTSHPWGNSEDDTYQGNYSEYPAVYDRTKKGLWPAIEDFLERHPEWSLLEHRTNHHGFTILQRKEKIEVSKLSEDSLIDYYLKNKIILCTGPSLNRYDLLKNSTEIDMNFMTFKKIFVTTNDPRIMNITFNGKKPDYSELIPDRGKQLDCLNCIVTTIKNAVNDPEVADDDIILFKHETVYINDMELIRKAMGKLLNEGYDMVDRKVGYIGGMYATDVFFVRVSAIKEIIKNFYPREGFPPEAWYCESYFTHYIVRDIPNIYSILYHHSNGGFTELGFYHIPSWEESHWPMWDRKNHDELFK
jgi:hypothetical protein